MSSYRYIGPVTLLNAGAMATATLTSTAIQIPTIPMACLYISWTGTSPVGTFSIQGSADNTNFVDMGLNVAAVATDTGTRFIDIGPTAAAYIRVVYTKTSGTGSLTVIGAAKTA